MDYDPARHISYPGEPVTVTDWANLRSIAREHLPIECGDAKRWEHDVSRIRRVLALPSYVGYTIEMDCFNREDAVEIERRLTAEEGQCVVFRYPGARP